MRQVSRAIAHFLSGLLTAGLIVAIGPASAAIADEQNDPLATADVDYPGDPASEALLVADEESRLAEVRAAAQIVRWQSTAVSGPYRLALGGAYTLVLTPRDQPYGVADLLELAPQTFVRQPDGSYLLKENLVVLMGASLDLTDSGPLTIRMSSGSGGFVSIVGLGGTVSMRGTASSPMKVTSWDPTTGELDEELPDGRAYIRVIGGKLTLDHVSFSGLGFWSGHTGGVSLTGTDDPQSITDPQFQDAILASVDAGLTADGTAEAPLPAGELPEGRTADGYSYVSAQITGARFDGNAFGLFISRADGVSIADSTVTNSLVDGLVMHRFVTNATVSTTSVTGSAGDGVVVTRATTGVSLSQINASNNGGSGIVLDGAPLADGPSPVGLAVGEYGNNSVTLSTASDNGRYGIEVIAGQNLTVSANTVDRNDMGIVVREGAAGVAVQANQLSGNAQHGIVLRDGVIGSSIQGNTIAGGPDGIYLRDSVAIVTENVITGVTRHGVTVIGEAEGVLVDGNTVSGSGTIPFDSSRAKGADIGLNDSHNWITTKTFWAMVRSIAQPLTIMWVVLGILLVMTAVRGAGRRRHVLKDPYADQRSLDRIIAEREPAADDLDVISAELRSATPVPAGGGRPGAHSLGGM